MTYEFWNVPVSEHTRVRIIPRVDTHTFYTPSTVHHTSEPCAICEALPGLPQATNRVTLNAMSIHSRQHKWKKRTQSERYHLRIQKKWDKRARTDPRWQVYGEPKQITLSEVTVRRLLK